MYPLLSKEEIEKRLDFVEELKKSPILLVNIRQNL
jgi:DNA mismatch repair ATPase MutS